MAVFSYDSKFSRVMMRVSQSCFLNLLWLVTSLPIVTMGAATAALYRVAFKITRDEEGNIAANFFKAFKDNFAQATVVWLIILGIAAVLGTDIYVLNHLRDVTTGPLLVTLTIALALVIVACVALGIVVMYVFPLVANVENSTFNMLKNALLLGTHYLFCTICVFGIHAIMAIAIIAVFTPLFILGEGLCAVLSSYLLYPVIMGNATSSSTSVTPAD